MTDTQGTHVHVFDYADYCAGCDSNMVELWEQDRERLAALEAENARLKTTNWIAVAYQEMDRADALEARLEAAERALLGLVQDNEKRGVRSAFYYRARRVLGFKPGESALTRPATAAEQEAGE